jgi:2-oxoglutarate dehydrogenase E2 component (dihydrolipoamide succinyltransferase)
MATNVIMPQLGESVVEGTVTKWLKREGDLVQEFEALLEVNTDKVDTEVPAPASGNVLRLLVAEGQTVRAGTLLAVIGQPGEPLPELSASPQAPEPGKPPPASEPPASASPPPVSSRADLGFVSPVVARIAAEHGVDLSQVRGSGQGGRITKKDVLAFVEMRTGTAEVAPWETPSLGELFRPTEELFGDAGPSVSTGAASAQVPGSVVPLDAVRKSIADHMVRSKATSAHVTTVMEVDLSRVVSHREKNKPIFARDGVNLTYTAYFVAASAAALKAVPLANASWTDQGIALHRSVNIGVAVSLGEQGLIVPVVKDADQKSLLGLAQAVNDLAGRARARKLNPDEVQGGTFTITNHGVSGSLFATPIINQPQVAILGVGALQKRVVVVPNRTPAGGAEDTIAIRPMAYLTLTFDHRVLDGAVCDAFLGKVVEALQHWGA